MSRRLTVLFAPDSFKGSLTSVQVAAALARGWASARPKDRLLLAPLADGGEGTLAAIEAAGGWGRRTAVVRDPLERPITASWLLSTDGRRAVVEMAEASGLSRVAAGERDAVRATSFGLGELLVAAASSGAEEVIVGIGGSATTDGGGGMLRALGAIVEEARVEEARVEEARVDLAGLHRSLGRVDLRVACDVTNPLLGERGAAAVYGPQKGASPSDVEVLDRRLAAFADLVEAAIGRRVRDKPGAGAAGGVGFGLLAIADRFRSFELRPGVELVMEAVGFDATLRIADVVVTGEGRIDAQTAFGKTAMGVARRAQEAGVSCVAVGGGVEPEGEAALASVGASVVPVFEEAISVEAAMSAGEAPVESCGVRIAQRLAGRLPPWRRRLTKLAGQT
ncbi:MAG TPA: glycerate kinase [Candidatus Limnocylindrales bacterium]